MDDPVYWDATYEIVRLLRVNHPDAKLDDLSLNTLFSWVIGLKQFADDPALGNETILNEILIEWIEETL